MQQVINIILPVFGAILAGYIFAWRGSVGKEGVKAITDFVFNIAIPLLLFRSLAQRDFSSVTDPSLIEAYFIPVLIMFFFSLLVLGRLLKLEGPQRALFAMCSIYSNLVLIGLPLILLTWGEAGLIPGSFILVFHPTILLTLCTIVTEIAVARKKRDERPALEAEQEGTRNRGREALGLARNVLRGVGRNPVILSVLAGLTANLMSVELPTAFDRFAELLGRAAVPCALFSVGAGLFGYKIRGDIVQALFLTVIKIVFMPAFVWLSAHYVFALPPLETAVATVIAGLPMGVTVYLFAGQYNTYSRRASTAVLLSTLGSVVTLSVLLTILPGVP